MKGLYDILKNLFILNLVLIFSKINISNEFSNIQEVRNAIKEIAYSYYMRGKHIQYDIYKKGFFNPEEATEQNINYLVCTDFTRNVYRQLLNITIPEILKYSRENIGKPEVVLHSNINSDNKMEMKIYSYKEINNYTTVINPSLNSIIPLVQIGDILSYTGHSFLIYDIITDGDDKVIDAVIMESTPSGSEFVNLKVSPKVTLPNGKTIGSMVYLLLQNAKNKIFKNIQEGTVRFGKLSEYKNWININNTNLRKEEYSILRFVHQDSEGNAIVKYTVPNQITNNQKIVLSNINLDRIKFSHLYIKKTVNVHNNNIVQFGDILNYTIIIKNMGSKIYTDNLIVTEILSV